MTDNNQAPAQTMRHEVLPTLRLLALALALSAGCIAAAQAATIGVLHRFSYTAASPSHYALGNSPQSELLQASDGNFYGTTVYGGQGKCPNRSEGGYTGCGTIFRMTPQGTVTVLYSFPYSATTNRAPQGAFPTAGLIQATDGFLYGVAQDGGLGGCNGALGCGTAFRISLAGSFKLLHQFCGSGDCTGIDEGGRPSGHLVQAANGRFYGATSQGGLANNGTLFSMGTAGGVTTLHIFDYTQNNDGYDPEAPLLLAPDGKTLYGTTASGGANGGGSGGGIVFKLSGSTVTILHSFDNREDTDAGTIYTPLAGLIFGNDGKLYGTTASGGTGGGLYSLSTDGSGFAISYIFSGSGSFGGVEVVTGLVLGSNGLMYGTALQGDVAGNNGSDGAMFDFNPVTGKLNGIASFTTDTGAESRGALIEGQDGFLYGTTSQYGNTAHDAGSVFRVAPALKH